ncbi:hypothetical protein BFP76_07740 [Amylibacter kogurei]|uniref:Peptidase M10 serralysin C-terminal domain-containing protein n=1 Tax=Paramylibacter kogurei TaxID=1889778 RepID=A0A2G5K3Y0_9RHOB|nr:hypothetical protein [Amylibacter kogurei]PIB23434.1 hypothetical protein BFP76_07740 [Amylibacter kogurei]
MAAFYDTPDGSFRFYGDFVYDDDGLPVSGILTRVIGYSVDGGNRQSVSRITDISFDIADTPGITQNVPYFYLSRTQDASLSFFNNADETIYLDHAYTIGVDTSFDTVDRAIINRAMDSVVTLENIESFTGNKLQDSLVRIQNGVDLVSVQESDNVRIHGGDMREYVLVYDSTDVYVSTGLGAQGEGSSNFAVVSLRGVDDFRVNGSGDTENVYLVDYEDTDANGDPVTRATENGVVFTRDGDDNIWTEGEGNRIYGGDGNDDFAISGGTDKLFGGSGDDHFQFILGAQDFSTRIRDFDANADYLSFYSPGGGFYNAQEAYDLFLENAVQRGGDVIVRIEDNRIVLHDTSMNDIDVDNFIFGAPIEAG